jgi:hypothetical protein
MHLIIKLLLLSVLLFSNVSIFADTCLDNNLSNAEYLKNACIKNIDAWKAPMVISGILPDSAVNDTVGNIIHAGYKFYRSTNYNFITEETGKKVYVATNWSVEQTDPINVNIEEAVNIVQRSRNKIKKSLSDENKFSNSIDKAPFSSIKYDISLEMLQLSFLINKKLGKPRRGGIIFDFNH